MVFLEFSQLSHLLNLHHHQKKSDVRALSWSTGGSAGDSRLTTNVGLEVGVGVIYLLSLLHSLFICLFVCLFVCAFLLLLRCFLFFVFFSSQADKSAACVLPTLKRVAPFFFWSFDTAAFQAKTMIHHVLGLEDFSSLPPELHLLFRDVRPNDMAVRGSFYLHIFVIAVAVVGVELVRLEVTIFLGNQNATRACC